MTRIKEKEFQLNTGESNITQLVTPLINGLLEAVLISTDVADITIETQEHGIRIFERIDVRAPTASYFPLAVQKDTGMHTQEQKFTYQATKWALNDKLIITAQAKKNTQVSIILRWQ